MATRQNPTQKDESYKADVLAAKNAVEMARLAEDAKLPNVTMNLKNIAERRKTALKRRAEK